MKEKQIVRVLDAVVHGARSSVEVSSITGLPLKHCSAWLSELSKCGSVHPRGKLRFHREGRPANEYAPSFQADPS